MYNYSIGAIVPTLLKVYLVFANEPCVVYLVSMYGICARLSKPSFYFRFFATDNYGNITIRIITETSYKNRLCILIY